MSLNRRRFIRDAAAASVSLSMLANPLTVLGNAIWRPGGNGPRVVIIGGGWSGLNIARQIRAEMPSSAILLIEKEHSFFSHPLSNLWLVDEVEESFLTHRYEDAAKAGGFDLLIGEAQNLERENRRVYTREGYVEYDYLVLAPGIDYDYPRSGVEDPDAIALLRERYPAAFIGYPEIAAARQKIKNFKGGVFALTVPNDNYRCMAAPYERACMIASMIKRRKLAAKVLLLDMNPQVTVKRDGFMAAFENFYPDIIDYQPSSEIIGFDPESRLVETEFDEYEFDDALIYPKVRVSRLVENMGLVDPTSAQKTAATDPFRYHLVDDERIYLTGDARSQPFSKSGNTAMTEAGNIARLIKAHSEDRDIEFEGPQTMCFSAVSIDPLESMSLIASYRYSEKRESFEFDNVLVMEDWKEAIATAGFVWAKDAYRRMFH